MGLEYLNYLKIEKQLEIISREISMGIPLLEIADNLSFLTHKSRYKILYFSNYYNNFKIVDYFIFEAMRTVYNLEIKVENQLISEFKFKKMVKKAVEFIKAEIKLDNINFELKKISISFEYEDVVWHSLNVAVISYLIGLKLDYSEEKLKNLIIASLFHDIGKSLIPFEILNKNGRLDEEEMNIIKNHSLYSKMLLNHLKSIDEEIIFSIESHHEKLDGSGYPNGLKGHEINELSRIICIADIFEAMVSERIYRKGYPMEDVIEMMIRGKFGKLDERIIGTLKEVVGINSIQGECYE